MSNLLVEPPAKMRSAWRPYRGKPFTKAARRRPLSLAEYPTRRFGFKPEIQPSTSSGKLRGTGEKNIYDILIDNGYSPQIEPFALKILRNGTSNGQEGWFVPDFYVNGDEDDLGKNGTFIEISMGVDLSQKLHKIRFVAEKYGKIVVHITRDNIAKILAEPEVLIDLIAQARIEELEIEVMAEESPEQINVDAIHARLGTTLEPRIKIEKARKPSKGKRRVEPSKRKLRNRPSRDPERRSERRALRKQTRDMIRANSLAPSATNKLRPATPSHRIVANGVAAIVYGQTKPAKTKAPVPPKSKQFRQHMARLATSESIAA